MQIKATDIRRGMVITMEGVNFVVLDFAHHTPGNLRAMVQTKLRNLKAGSQTEHRFRSEDKVDRVTLEQHEMQYLYHSDDEYHFMNTENYEQIVLDAEALGDAANYLIENLLVQVEFYEGSPMGVSLPKTVD